LILIIGAAILSSCGTSKKSAAYEAWYWSSDNVEMYKDRGF